MGFESDFVVGFASLLATAGVGVWKLTGSYATTDVAIAVDAVPLSPNDAITLTDYVVSDDPTLSDSVLGLQVRTRKAGADPRPVKDLDGAIFALLHGMPATTLPGGVHVVSCFRRSGASLGQDANGRWSRSSNYYATVHRPSTNRT